MVVTKINCALVKSVVAEISAPALQITNDQCHALDAIARSQTAAFHEVQRVRTLLNAANGMANCHNAGVLEVTANAVCAWRSRFEQEELAQFTRVRSGRGRKPTISQTAIEEIVYLTQTEKQEAAVNAFAMEREQLLESKPTRLTERHMARQVALDATYRQTRPFAEAARSPHHRKSIVERSPQWTGASSTLSNAEETPQQRVVSSSEITSPTAVRTVRAANGIGLRGFFGLLPVRIYDRPSRRLGKLPDRHIGQVLPTVARCKEGDVSAATGATDEYVPLAGVVVDPECPSSVRLASRIDDELAASKYAGTRFLVVFDPRARAHYIQRIIHGMGRGGLDRVGLIFCTPRRRKTVLRVRIPGWRA